jgi:hypothetical protein
MNVALHAEDVPAIEPAALGCVPADDVGRLIFRTDPSAGWLQSPWPIDRIWRANQPESDPSAVVDLATGPARLEIRRRGDVVTLQGLEPSDFAFRAALGAGATLEAATEAALGQDPGFDLAAALQAVLGDALVASFMLEPGEGSGPE